MASLSLHDFHFARGAIFTEQSSFECVSSYGSVEAEYLALTQSSACFDLSFRSRICLLGADRDKFLHGQVTQEVTRLAVGEGNYAALVTAKGKLETDLTIYKLAEELLLDFEPCLTEKIAARLIRYIIAEDVQIVDVAPHYGLLSIQGPDAAAHLRPALGIVDLPEAPLSWRQQSTAAGELYITRNSRFGSGGYDLFVPQEGLESTAQSLTAVSKWAGLDAAEIARIENGIPRFGVDMDETNLAPEALSERAISYAKGCYIGQEVIARIRTYGQVAKALRLIRLPPELPGLPARGAKLFKGNKEVGFVTSSAVSPKHGAKVALGYVRKEANAPGEVLQFGAPEGGAAQILSFAGRL